MTPAPRRALSTLALTPDVPVPLDNTASLAMYYTMDEAEPDMTTTDVKPSQSDLPSFSTPCFGQRVARAASFVAALVLAMVSVFALAAFPTSALATSPTTAALLSPPPQTPGFHHLYYAGQLKGTPRTLAYSVYLPRNYDPARPCPMIVYLVGLGDRGENHQGLFNNGPPVYLSTNSQLADWAPFIVLAPQCPKDLRWESPGVAPMVRELIDYATQTWAVDSQRLYLTGLSNGGTGCWNVALEAPTKFAAIAVFSGMAADPKPMSEALAGTTVLIVCGSADGRFATASHTMYDALRAAKLDVLFVEIPDGKHGIWHPFYASRAFYEFLLTKRRNAPPPTTRATAQDLLAIGLTTPNTADDQLAKPLHQFLPWWFISNCGRGSTPGLKQTLLGRRDVFVTTPLGKDVACRLMHSVTIPAGKATALDLTVAAPPGGQWELLVRANGDTLLKRIIGTAPTTSPSTTRPSPPRAGAGTDVWVNFHVDLTALAGQQVYLELLNASVGASHSEAYWGSVQLTSQ